jgi:hypothetical protein
MRITKILTVAAAALVVSATTSQAATYEVEVAPAVTAVVAPMTLAVVQDPPAKAEVKIDLDDDANTVWYTDPVWLAVGAIALLIVIVLAVMAARGGGNDRTTVVR